MPSSLVFHSLSLCNSSAGTALSSASPSLPIKSPNFPALNLKPENDCYCLIQRLWYGAKNPKGVVDSQIYYIWLRRRKKYKVKETRKEQKHLNNNRMEKKRRRKKDRRICKLASECVALWIALVDIIMTLKRRRQYEQGKA